jgi:hypothetical protein
MGESSNGNRHVISTSCSCAGVARGFTNLVIRKLPDGRIELDPHVTGTCVLTLDEDAARAMCDAIQDWLG